MYCAHFEGSTRFEIRVSHAGEPKNPTRNPALASPSLVEEGRIDAEERAEKSAVTGHADESMDWPRPLRYIFLQTRRKDRIKKRVRRTARHTEPGGVFKR